MSQSFENFLRQCVELKALIVLEPMQSDQRIGFLALACRQDGKEMRSLNLTCEVVGSQIHTIVAGLTKPQPGRVH